MKRFNHLSQAVLLLVCSALLTFGQAAPSNDSNNIVPRLVRFSGAFTDANGKPPSSAVGVTFSLYKDSEGGAPLWIETQNVQPDSKGHYTVLLGSTKPDGVTSDLFASGEARWLGVQPQGQAEQPRVLMVSVPYALKAVDAETLGGKPASAYLTADMLTASSSANSGSANLSPTSLLSVNRIAGLKFGSAGAPPCPPLTGGGTTNYIPLWTPTGCKLGNSIMQQTPTAIGIGASPAYTLDIPGSAVTGNVAKVRIGSAAAHPGTVLVQGHNTAADTVVTVKETNGTAIDVQGGGTGTGIAVVEGSGIAINVAAYNQGTGIVVQKGSKYGLIAQGQFGIAIQGAVPYNNAGAMEGVSGSSWTDTAGCPLLSGNDGCAGVVGAEYGSNNDTIGVYGYTASPVGAGVYGESVSPSSVLLGPPPDPSAAIWGDSSAQFGILGTSDSNTAVYGLNSTVNDPYSPTAYFENDSSYDTDVVLQTSGFNDPNAGGCMIDTAGDLSCDRTISAQNISNGSGGANTDLAGSCTLTAGTCNQAFTLPYSFAPVCVATDTTAVSPVQVVVSPTSLTINGSNGDVANYICIGRDNPPPKRRGLVHDKLHHHRSVHAAAERAIK
jgi:hypothetical protein